MPLIVVHLILCLRMEPFTFVLESLTRVYVNESLTSIARGHRIPFYLKYSTIQYIFDFTNHIFQRARHIVTEYLGTSAVLL